MSQFEVSKISLAFSVALGKVFDFHFLRVLCSSVLKGVAFWLRLRRAAVNQFSRSRAITGSPDLPTQMVRFCFPR